MGTRLSDIIHAETITLQDLSGKTIAIDAFNTLYQFLSTIRQPDGTPLKDRRGRVTSHLSGLFYRTMNLMENGIRLVYVFDGKSPELKAAEKERRKTIREAAFEEWERALEEGRIEDARKAAQRSSRLTTEMIDESKKLLSAMGLPVIQAPSEGEAMAAQMARADIVWASASQDNDSLLYNCPRMIRNLSVTGRRRTRSRSFKIIHPELIKLADNLRLLGITREQLIDIAIMVGTDYNDKIPGVGPKTALKLIKQYGDLETIIEEKGYAVDFPIDEIRNIFLNPPPLEEMPALNWGSPDSEAIRKILCDEHDFSESRITSALERLNSKLEELAESSLQSSLTDFF